ncbi:radical SAM protein [candidate division KSB1 bacterium]|nr:radical SAM protein [candidate division KSB1 bacterium]
MSFSLLKFWHDSLEHWHEPRHRAAEGLHQSMRENAKLTWFDIDLHKACNLTCDHCFYNDHYSTSTSPALAPEFLEEAIRQAVEMRIEVMTFSGMEPTLGKNFRVAIQTARAARDQYAPAAKIGLITNALTLPQHLSFLESEPPDFIDVSIDGWKSHDRIRANTRDRVIANFKQAKACLRNTRVGTSTVLRNDNIDDVILMIERTAEFNSHFYFEPVVAAVDKHIPSLASENLIHFVQRLRRVAEIFHEQELHFSLLLNGDQALPLFYHDLLEPEEVEEDELHSLYIRRRIGRVEIDFILRIIPEYFWRGARLSYDGYWLGTCDLLQAPDFHEVASGSFIETPSIKQLFERSLARDTLFYQSLQELFLNPCGHTEREQQYCLSCFSTRMVKMMHQRYGAASASYTGATNFSHDPFS